MKCTRFRKLLIPYSEGLLSKERATPLERHLSECDECARELQAISCTADVLRKVEYPVFEPAVDLRSRVLAQIADETPLRRPWWQPSRIQTYSAAMAGLLLVAIAGAGMWRMMEGGFEASAPSAKVEQRSVEKGRLQRQVAPLTPPTESPGRTSAAKPSKPRAKTDATESFGHWYGRPAAPPAGESPRKAVAGAPVDSYSYLRTEETKEAITGRVEFWSAADTTSDEAGVGLGYRAAKSTPARDPSQEMTRSMKQSASGGSQTAFDGGFAALQPPGSAAPAPTTEADAHDKGTELAGRAFSMHSPAAIAGDRRHDFLAADGAYGAGNSSANLDTPIGADIRGLEVKLRDFPSSVTVIGDLMKSYRQAGRPRDEYNMAQRLTQLDPKNAGHWLARAQAADRVPMPRTAEVCYERAIKLGLKGAELEQAEGRVKALEAARK